VALVVGKWNFRMGYIVKDTDRVKRSVQNHPISVPNCPTEIPHGMSWNGSRTFFMRGLGLPAWAMAHPRILWSCVRQEGCSNVQLRTHSPVNKVDQCLNWSTKKESFPVKILVDFYFFDISEFKCKKKIPFTHQFLRDGFKFKNYFCNKALLHCFLITVFNDKL